MCAGLGILRSLLETYGVSRFQHVLDDLAGGTLTLIPVLIYGAVIVCGNVVAYLDERPKTRALQELYYFFKTESIGKASTVALEAVNGIGTGVLLQRIEAGAVAGRKIIFDFWMRTVREIVPDVAFGLLFIMLIDWRIAAGVVGGYIVLFTVTNLLLERLYTLKQGTVVDDEKINRLVARSIMELVTFRVLGMFSRELREARRLAEENTERSVKLVMTHEFFFAFFAAFMNVVKVGIIAMFALGWVELSVGALVALLLYMDRVYNPIAIFNVIYVQYKLDRVTYQRLQDYYRLPDDESFVGDESGRALLDEPRSVALDAVDFTIDGQAVLDGVSMSVDRGEAVGVVGPSGAGKSTLLRVLLGLLKPTKGVVLVDKTRLDDLSLTSFYEHVSYVSQDPPIFDGTIRENLMVSADFTDAQIMAVLDEVGLREFVSSRKGGLESQIGERGTQLSGGEKQRLALARVLLRPKSLVVLDEATSALDSLTERRVLTALRRTRSTAATVVVAHRLKAMEELDRVYVLADGEIVEIGTSADLRDVDGIFAQMWRAMEEPTWTSP